MGAYSGDNRTFTAYLQYGSRTLDNTKIATFTIKESASSDSRITMGTVNSSSLELELINISSEKTYLLKNVALTLTIDCSSDDGTEDDLLLGVYYIDDIEWTKSHTGYYSAKITAYDAMYKLEKNFELSSAMSEASYVTIEDIVERISDLTDVEYDSSDWNSSYHFTSLPSDVTCRQMLGYCAGVQGSFAYIGYSGTTPYLKHKWYGTSAKTIPYEDIYEGGLTTDTATYSTIQLKYIETGTNDATVIYPSNAVVGQTVSFENPLITTPEETTDPNIAKDIYESRLYVSSSYVMTYLPVTVKWRGDLTNSLGDKISVETDDSSTTVTSYITDRTITFDGGLVEEYSCPAENDTSVSFNGNVSMNKITRKMSSMETAIQEATEVLNDIEGENAGVFEITKNGDVNTGWIIKSTTDNKVVKANSSGIGFSNDGGSTMGAAAIYIDSNGAGHINGIYINASEITTGILSTDRLNIGSITTGINTQAQQTGGILISQNSITGLTEDLADMQDQISDQSIEIDQTTTIAQNGRARYLTCSTAADTADKECYLSDSASWTISTGSTITVKFTNTGYYYDEDASPQYVIPKLVIYNPDSTVHTSATNIYYNSATLYSNNTACWNAGGLVSFIYNGTGSYIGWHMLDNVANTILSDWCQTNDRTYINGAKIATGTIDASTIYVGTLASRDASGGVSGTCQFDLDSGTLTLGTTSGAHLKSQSSGIDAYDSSNKLGTLAPVYLTSGSSQTCYMGLFYNDSNADGISLGYENSSGSFDTILEVRKDSSSNPYVQCNTNSSKFAGFITNDGTFDYSLGKGTVTNVDGTSVHAIAIELNRPANNNQVICRLDLTGATSKGRGSIRTWYHTYDSTTQTNTGHYSKWLSLGSSNLYWGDDAVLTTDSSIATTQLSGTVTSDHLPSSVLYTSSTLSGAKISGAISNGSTITGTIIKGTSRIESGPETYGYGVAGHLYLCPIHGSNYIGNSFSPSHGDGTYGIEIIDDNTTSVTGIKLRPTSDSWSYYIGSASRRFDYGYFTNCIGTNAYQQDSDRKLKTDIADLPTEYETFFDNLRPVIYKKTTGDRVHTGFVAQEVENALALANLSSEEYAGLCKNAIIDGEVTASTDYTGLTDESIRYSLRYEDFIALCVDKIHKLEARLKVLEG